MTAVTIHGLTQSLTCADKLCCRGHWPDVQKLATREATMLFIPVVVVIGGILALVLYLEKDLHPIEGRANNPAQRAPRG